MKTNSKRVQSNACDCLYQIAKTKENFSESLTYLEEKDKLVESLNVNTASKKLEVFAKLSLQEKESAYQEQLTDEQLKRQSFTNLLLQIALASGIIFILILFRMLNRIKKQNNEIHTQSDILRTTNKNLSQSNEELERFAYIVSHDLKTPLMGIVQFTKLLSAKIGDSAVPVVSECIQHIEKGGIRMTRLIEDVLAFSKNTNTDIKDEEINLGGLLSEISDLLLSNFNNGQIELNYDALPTIRWNYTKILLLLKNLIENGLKYNNSEIPTINIYAKTDATWLSLYIEDNGIGIKEEYFNKVFIMFERLHNHKDYSGTGLGLATCKKIVNDFGGEISIKSELNKGSVFKLKFPINMIVAKTKLKQPANLRGQAIVSASS